MSQCPNVPNAATISIPTLAKRCKLSRRNLQRMAADGLIPGASRTNGGQWRVLDDKALAGWLNARNFTKMLRETLGRGRSAPVRRAVSQLAQRLDTAIQFTKEAGRRMPKKSDFDEVMQMKNHLIAMTIKIDSALEVFAEYEDFVKRCYEMDQAVKNAASSGLNG